MKISLNWLKDFTKIKLSPEKLGQALSLHSVEVESWDMGGGNFDNILVGKILAISKHPNADRLHLVKVDIGNKKVDVVCGGINLKLDQLVAIALPGAKVKWHGEGELVELRPAKVRGVESMGMICAANEIGLGDQYPHKDFEILDLTKLNLKVGTPLAKAMSTGDVVIEIDNKSLSNRPDLLGHYGLARDIAAFTGEKLKEYKVKSIKNGKGVSLKVSVEDKSACPRYLAVAMENIKIAPSPEWLVKRLNSAGVRAINNIVDITNYVLLELGQPMHAFDANLIEGQKIIVRRAKAGETFKTLDGNARKLDNTMLVIADAKKAVALAGVMGGANSEIKDSTKKIIFESATFDAGNIRQTSQKLGLRTESSMRYEKSLDPNLAELALRKAVAMVLEIIPEAKVASKVVDVANFKLNQGPIKISFEFINSRAGAEIKPEVAVKILKNLGFEVKKTAKELSVNIPTWRATKDIAMAEDILEEILRIYGYENIPGDLPEVKLEIREENKKRKLERQVKEILSPGEGLNEVYNYAFLSDKDLTRSGFENNSEIIRLANAVSQDLHLLRPSLIPSLLKNLELNQKYSPEVKIYEIGRVFRAEKGEYSLDGQAKEFLPIQDYHLAGAIMEEKNSRPFYRAKKAVENLLEKLNIGYSLEEASEAPKWAHPGRSQKIKVKGEAIGFITEISPQISANYGIQNHIGIFALNFEKLANAEALARKYAPVSKYPFVKYDLSIIIPEAVVWEKIKNEVAEANSLVQEVMLFDVYRGQGIEPGQKSLAFRIVYGSKDRTLEQKEVEKIHTEILKRLESKFSAKLRS